MVVDLRMQPTRQVGVPRPDDTLAALAAAGASAALPPMIRTRSVFLMSFHELVIAPRPNVGPRLDTVGACHIRACVSRATTPMARNIFTER